jgi:hypothetical protein
VAKAAIRWLAPTPAAARRAAAERQAQYQRAYRRRQRKGEAVFHVRAGPDVIEALLVSERLGDEASRNRKQVEAELALILQQWAAYWLR